MPLKNPVRSTGIDPGTVRLVVQRLNHYATAGPEIIRVGYKIQKLGNQPEEAYNKVISVMSFRCWYLQGTVTLCFFELHSCSVQHSVFGRLHLKCDGTQISSFGETDESI